MVKTRTIIRQTVKKAQALMLKGEALLEDAQSKCDHHHTMPYIVGGDEVVVCSICEAVFDIEKPKGGEDAS